MKNVIKLTMICLLLIASWTNTFGQNSIKLPDSESEFKRTLQKAKEGDAHSMYIVACCYLDGHTANVNQSISKGKKYLRMAAEKNMPEACARMYKLDPIANEGYRNIAKEIFMEQGTGYAYYNIADLYSNSTEECSSWLVVSHNCGYTKATEQLRIMQQNDDKNAEFEDWLANITPALDINRSGEINKNDINTMELSSAYSEVDVNLPISETINKNAIAIIIGNENYSHYSNGAIADVPFAINDARKFSEYCKKTLGLEERNVILLTNATKAQIEHGMDRVRAIVSSIGSAKANIIFFYSGHGVPDEDINTNKSYLLPIDVNGSQTKYCICQDELIETFKSIQAQSTTIFLDACFSGYAKSTNDMAMVNAKDGTRAIVRKVQPATPKGNMIIFSSASNNQKSWPLKEKKHGLFTYYLLKKLQDTKGETTLGELSRYITDNVSNKSAYFDMQQTPVIKVSSELTQTWKHMKLK